MLDRKSVDELLLIEDHTRIDSLPLYRNGVARGSFCMGIDEPIKKKQKPAKRKSHIEASGPRIPFCDVATCWFAYKGGLYCIQSVPVAILRQAVYGMVHDEWAHVLLKQESLDIVERWYILLEARGLKLYKSRFEAEKGLQDVSTRN